MTDSTDNARGPERIWAESKTCTVDASGASRLLAMDREFSRGTEYIRADLAPDPLGAVKVKPLVWGYHPAGTIAAPPTGHAYIIDTRMKGRVYSVKGFNPEREFGSLDEAKAAAQADYEARIMAALEPAPAEVTVQEQDVNTMQIKPHPRDKKLKEFAALWLRGPIPADLMADLADILEDDDYTIEKRVHHIVWQAIKWGMEVKEGRG